jgi:hypothetical protein
MTGPIGARLRSKSMSNDKPLPIDEGLRGLAAKLERRRNRILRAKRSFEVIADAYSLVLSDLRSASGESRADSEATTAA